MKLAGQRGIRSSKWVPSEILHADDINFISEVMYTNLTALLASIARPDVFGENEDIVMQGFTLNHNNLLTCDFSDGIACSFSGYYLLDGAWGFVASAGDIFSVVKPVVQSVAFTTGGTFARIDLLEVRPIRTAYDSKSRQFKDPITGLVTSSPIDTKYEYGYEFAVREGDDTSALTKEQTTWTVNAATVGSDIAGKYVLFSARSGDYYIWYNTGSSGDPAVSGRTGIEVSISAGNDKDAIALATRTELNSHQLVTDGEIVISGATNQFIITVDYYVNVTDGTNGDMGSFFDAIAITQGNGVVYHTAGWIKIAEVNIGASTTAITQNDILDVRDSDQWENEPSGTRFVRWRAEEIRIEDTGNRITAKDIENAIQELAGAGRTNETIKQNQDDIDAAETDLNNHKNDNITSSNTVHGIRQGAGNGLDADQLDGKQSGNGDGNIPVSNGTKCVNLDADEVDGAHAGNAENNVAKSNGTKCVNLNADKIDGAHAGNANGNVGLANGTKCTNLNADKVDGADKDTDGTLSGNSDSSVSTEKAVKTYVDAYKTKLASVANGEGASLIGVEDAGERFDGADVEAILAEIQDQILVSSLIYTAGENITNGWVLGLWKNDLAVRYGHRAVPKVTADTVSTGSLLDIGLAKLSGDYFLAMWMDDIATEGLCRIGEWTGTSITWKTAESEFCTYAPASAYVGAAHLGSNMFAIYWRKSGSPYELMIRIGQLSGSSINWLTSEAVVDSYTGGTLSNRGICPLNNGRFLLCWGLGSTANNGLARVGHYDSGLVWDTSEFTFDATARCIPNDVFQLNGNIAVIVYNNQSTGLRAVLIEFNGSDTLSLIGSSVQFDATGNPVGGGRISSTRFAVCKHDGNDNIYVKIGRNTGSGITFDVSSWVNIATGGQYATAPGVVGLDHDNVVVIYFVDSALDFSMRYLRYDGGSGIDIMASIQLATEDDTYRVCGCPLYKGVAVGMRMRNSGSLATFECITTALPEYKGMAMASVTATNPVSIQQRGWKTDVSGYTAGNDYFINALNNTLQASGYKKVAGALTPTQLRLIGD